MTSLSDHIENALNEARMLLLGGQVLLGFSYRICFEKRFDQLSWRDQLSQAIGLALMTAALGWLIWPAAFHQIAQKGRESEAVHNFASRILDWALLPFALGFGFTIYPVCVGLNVPHPVMAASAVALFALALWYAVPLYGFEGEKRECARERRRRLEQKQPGGGDLSDRIKKVLIECRMALPGAQAFLGFQFAIVFADSFEKLPRSSQWIHFASLMATTIAIVLLIAPAAYHRIAEAGEDSEHFHSVASAFLLAALVFLAPGMSGDLFVVLRKTVGSLSVAGVLAGVLLLLFYGLWFGASALRARTK
ncbi:MAG: hypothetical protein JO187_08430 [Acidobacteria bacterium]|nr:hypothetical protein [Acidobacteriota bacterium]